MLHSEDKKALTRVGAAVVVVIVAIAALTAVLVATSDDDPLPTVSVLTDDGLVRAEPGYWCEVDLTDCRPADPRQVEQLPIKVTRAPAPIESTVSVSVPSEVADGLGWAIAQYATPRGVQRVTSLERPGETFTTKFHSRAEAVLLGIEVWSASTVLQDAPQGLDSPDFSVLMRGIFTIDTVPDGFQVTNPTELPDTSA